MIKFKTFIFFLFLFLIMNTGYSYASNSFISLLIDNPQILPDHDYYVLNIDNNLEDKNSTTTYAKISSKDEVVEVFNHSNKKLYLTNSDIEIMAKVVFAESKGESYEGKVAVASVILNRTISPSFPSTIEKVITQKNAFSCVINGEIKASPNEDCYRAVMEAIKGKDPTNQALYFYNPKVATCNWMKNIDKKNVKTIGKHVFFQI